MKAFILRVVLTLATACALAAGTVRAADYYARTAGAGVITTNWNQNTTWTSSATCNGAATAGTPGAGDNVFICSGKTVNITANAQAASVTFIVNTPAGGTNSSLIHGAGVSLAVGGNVMINGSTAANGTRLWNIGTGSATVGGNLTLAGGSTNARIARTDLTSGTLTITGNLVYNSANAARAVINTAGGAASAQINLAGLFTLNTTGTLAMGTGAAVFNYNGAAAAQTVRFGSVIAYRNLHLNNSNAAGATLSAAVSATNVTGNIRVQSGILNNGGFAMVGGAGDTFEIANGARFNLTGTTGMPSAFSTYALGATSTTSFQGGNQTVAAVSVTTAVQLTYGHVIAQGGSTKTAGAATPPAALNIAGNFSTENATTFTANTNDPIINVTGNMAINGSGIYQSSNNAARALSVTGNLTVGGTYTGNGSPLNIAGDLTRTGTFTSGTGVVTFNGASMVTPQTLTGATTFTSMTVNNTGLGLSLANNMTVTTAAAGSLVLTNGVVTTGANVLITQRPCNNAATVTRTNGYVVGNFQKAVPNGNTTCVFEVGGGGNYSPASLVFTGVGGTGGGLIGRVGLPVGDHPNIGTSGLNAAKSANRWWGFTTTGVTGTVLPAPYNYGATLTFVAGDVDGGANTANFEIERWNGATWAVTTVGARTPTSTQATGITALGDFAIAEKTVVIPTPGRFNAFEPPPGTAITGNIKTKIAGAGFDLAVVAVNLAGTAQLTTFTDTVLIDLVGNNTLGVALDGNNCPTTFTDMPDVSPSPTITNGVATVSFAAVPDSWRDVRVRIRWPAAGPFTVTSCSSNNFAIRPNAITGFAASNNTRTTAGTTNPLTGTTFGAVLHNAGRPFSVRASAVNAAGSPAVTTNYVGAPVATLTACGPGVGFEACTATQGTLSLTTTFAAGLLASDVAIYDDVGSFNLQLIDDSFASVDNADSSLLERRIQSAVIPVGRFTPDNFAVIYNVPVFAPTCTGFTYQGQLFNYSTPPVITVTAREAGGATTARYTGTWWRLNNAALTPALQSSRYTAASGTLDTATGLPAVTVDPVIVDGGAGSGTLTFSSGSGLLFTRNNTTPAVELDAEIALSINIIDSDSVAYASNPAAFGAASAGNGILFSDGNAGTTNDKRVRYGRLRLGNVSGSQQLPLRVPVEAQYWNGTAFITNTLDSCTTLAAGNIGLGNYLGSLGAGETTGTIVNSPLQAGRSAIQLSAPGVGNQGSVDVTLNLGGGAAADACAGFAPAATAGNLAHLRGRWCNPPGTYLKDPSARARFGVSRGSDQTIYRREQ